MKKGKKTFEEEKAELIKRLNLALREQGFNIELSPVPGSKLIEIKNKLKE